MLLLLLLLLLLLYRRLQCKATRKRTRGIFLGTCGGGVPPGSPNPDPISDQKIVRSISTPVFRTGVRRKIMLSLPRLERNKTIYKNPFRIRTLLFSSYSFEIETTNTFMHSRISRKTIPELRPK